MEEPAAIRALLSNSGGTQAMARRRFPAGHRVVVLFRCPVTRQFVSELGMYPPGTWDRA